MAQAASGANQLDAQYLPPKAGSTNGNAADPAFSEEQDRGQLVSHCARTAVKRASWRGFLANFPDKLTAFSAGGCIPGTPLHLMR